jgi:hypothetical protein
MLPGPLRVGRMPQPTAASHQLIVVITGPESGRHSIVEDRCNQVTIARAPWPIPMAPKGGADGRRRLPRSRFVCTNGSDEVLVYANNLLIGRAAFETAKRLLPRDQLEYRRGAQGARAEPAIAAEGRDRLLYPRGMCWSIGTWLR